MVVDESLESSSEDPTRFTVQLLNESGQSLGSPFDVSSNVTKAQLELLCNGLLQLEESVPCSFYLKDQEIVSNLATLIKELNLSPEHVLQILYQPQAVYYVQAVTRCTSSLPGHGEAVISAQFSPDGRYLASGSGDKTVRFWDLTTELPQYTCQGHPHWVLCISWSPDGKTLASSCKNGQVRLWNPETGVQIGKAMLGHKKYVGCLSWEPLHISGESRRLVSGSKDNDVRIWDTVLGQTEHVLAGHTSCITCVRWGGEGLIYSASQDRSIKVWRATDGILCRTLEGHGHWVNTMALNTDYAMRTGAFDPRNASLVYKDVSDAKEVLKERALKRYADAKGAGAETMVSGSDDFTLFLWHPAQEKKPVARMTGHQQLVNQVAFSPDGRMIASASFDKSIKLWCGRTGKYIASLRGHVQAVYQVAWSADSRLLVSGSADSTLKLWDIGKRNLAVDLPGHADEVYAVDWSPDGQRVVSGGKDKILKLWRK